MPVRLYIVCVVATLLAVVALRIPLGSAEDRALATAAASPERALITRYCTTCHDEEERTGGLALDVLDVEHPALDAPEWEAVVRKLRTGMMPPAGEPRPARAEIDSFAGLLETQLDTAAKDAPNPGAPALHRLNRAEYANVIRDLLALDVDVETLLPADDAAEGFDNIADVLGVSPSLVEGYVSAAMKISRSAVGDRAMQPTRVTYRAPAGLDQSGHIEGLPLGARGGFLVTHNFPLDADYEFRISGGGGGGFPGRGGGSAPLIDVTLDGQPVEAENTRSFHMRVPAGPVTIGVALVDRSRSAGVEDLFSAPSRQAGVQGLVIIGPNDPTGPGDTPSRRKIFICRPDGQADETPCARRILAHLATLAYRRPVDETEPAINTLMTFYDQGRHEGDFETGVQRALARLLVDPQFLFRFEDERDDLPAGAVYRVSDVELASRLSFFLWSSIPDEELLDLAGQDRLSDPRVLRAQITRMLADPRADALVANFAGQWLHLRELASAEPDSRDWDENLRSALERETELLFNSIVREDRNIVDLLDADYTFLDERLARHYGVEGVHGSYFRRVSLPEDSPRRGLLGQGSILTVTSVANRTSPVVRGAWILENLMGAPPPKPPPGVEVNLDAPAEQASSLRERLEQHRADSVCATCHNIMDPIGLSLENFDKMGAWRTADAGVPIDASGILVDGTPVDGVNDLRTALLSRSDAFVTVATEKLMTYALGRGVEYFDEPAVRAVVRGARDQDYAFSAIVYGIVTSTPFQMRMKPPAVDLRAAGAADGREPSTGVRTNG